MSRPHDGQARARRTIPLLVALLLPIAFLTGFALRGSTVEQSTKAPSEDSPEVGFARDMTVHHAQAVDLAERIRIRTPDPALKLLATDIVLTQQHQIGRFQGWLELWGVPASSTNRPMAWMASPKSANGASDAATVTAGHDMQGMDHGGDVDTDNDTEKISDTKALGALMPGLAERDQVNALSTLPIAAAERSFLELMIRHHIGGVDMANAVLTRTNRPEVTRIATSIVNSQTGEVTVMKQLLSARTAGAS
jgi:uncharacterized protein (DUF305 family)